MGKESVNLSTFLCNNNYRRKLKVLGVIFKFRRVCFVMGISCFLNVQIRICGPNDKKLLDLSVIYLMGQNTRNTLKQDFCQISAQPMCH